MFEPLESRRMMSATVTRGVLYLVGTDGADMIEISQYDRCISATVNGESFVTLQDVRRIVVKAKAGNDEVLVNTHQSPKPLRMEINAGAGNDTVYAGAGDDVIRGKDGHDRLWGGAGNDVIRGDRGDDSIYGEEGNDLLGGDAGADWLNGHVGNDRAYGGRGDDYIVDTEGRDSLYGESGADTCRTHDDRIHIWGGERPDPTDYIHGGGQRGDVAFSNPGDIVRGAERLEDLNWSVITLPETGVAIPAVPGRSPFRIEL